MTTAYLEGLPTTHPNYDKANIQRIEGKSGRVNSDFKPSSYTGKITTDATGVGVAIATGATKLLLQSLEVTGLEEYGVLAFGTSSADAVANLNIVGAIGTTGIIIRSADSTAGGVAPDQILAIPDNATHFALVNGVSGQAQVIMVTQGI